ncbi:MAG: ATP-binding protein, partial [Candidatus Thorarchaeota archaeon]
LAMAIADLIDNSVFAGAKNVGVDYDWNSGRPWIRITDDGAGMTEARLKEAMRLGSQSPLEQREEDDLGRFGLGLKTASFSQCKTLIVHTKVATGQSATRCWDLDHVRRSKKWELATRAPRGSRPLLDEIDTRDSGTVVLWQNLDRVVGENAVDDEDGQAVFLDRFRQVAQYLEVVFHRYLIGRDRVRILVGRHECETWDPFLTTNQFTEELSTERLDDHRVSVTPYILPHVSKRTRAETEKGSGLHGWNAHQGFYVYRNRRMIIPGGYLDLDFTPEEHFKLCRIRVDLPNDLDHEWCVDVRKAAASPPSHVRGDLERIARAARKQAVRIYRARTGSARQVKHRNSEHDVWLRKRRGDKTLYEINRNNEAIKRVLAELGPSKSWVRKLFHLVERTVPHRLIILDNAEHEDCHVALPPDIAQPPEELLALCKELFLERLSKGGNPHQAADFVCAFFDDHVSYRARLDKMIEEMQ